LLALASVVLAAAPLHAVPPAQPLADVRVFAIYEPVLSRQDVELLSRVRPDFVCRGWFKWHNTPDWQAYAPLAHACRERGILLQGGLTCAALYPGENGIDEATFRDFACGDTRGQPFRYEHFSSGFDWYHLSLYNPKVVAMLKREARLQLDAGAAGIWYDEIEGYYDWNPTEGYDAYACAAFRDWLIKKYCDGQGWRDDDPRWRTQFGIDLAQHGGSIRTFDYLRHLQTTPGQSGRPLADNPPQGHPRAWATSPNPLYREWGYAWDRKAAGTFRFDTAAAIFADLLADADRYAREKHNRALISTYNHNGTARPGVAFLQPHNGAQPTLRRGRLDGRASYLLFYEDLITDAAEVCTNQPVVFFIDWPGETDRLTALPRADQTHFFSTYIPEAYAAGGEFALPLRGYSYIAAHQGTLATLTRLADFYRDLAPWLRGSRRSPAQPDPQERLTLRTRDSACGTALHLVNHAFDTRDVWPLTRTNLTVSLAWDGPAPEAAFAVSPDFPEQRPVPATLVDGRLTLAVGALFRSAVVLLPRPGALRAVTGSATGGAHILDPHSRALAVARDGGFTLWLPPSSDTLECLETGELQPARSGATFAPPPAGGFASGLLLDAFGIPARHAALACGARRWHTDAWGRYRVPLAQASAAPLTASAEPGVTNALPAHSAFTAWKLRAPRTSIGPAVSLEGERPREPPAADSLGGFWANWANKGRLAGVIDLAAEAHDGRAALRCRFTPAPGASWSNVNSPAFDLGGADAVEVTYAGDGSPRAVYAVLHAHPRFYRAKLPLEATAWTTRRLALRDFHDDSGAPFDPAAVKGAIAFQLAPDFGGSASPPTATVWLHGVALVHDTPVQEQWRSDGAFDALEVDNLRAGHVPQPPLPPAASREPLLRFTEPAPSHLANWDGKGAPSDKPLVVIERVEPAAGAPFLRVTFPAGREAWGNANLPLALAALKGREGLVLRLRASPACDVALTLHASMKEGGMTFYPAEAEATEAWSDVVLPWSEFKREPRSARSAFSPASVSGANLQLCRPHCALERDLVVELESVDTFSNKP
jgi:hypothetical protein